MAGSLGEMVGCDTVPEILLESGAGLGTQASWQATLAGPSQHWASRIFDDEPLGC